MPNRIEAGEAKALSNRHREAKATAPLLDGRRDFNSCARANKIEISIPVQTPLAVHRSLEFRSAALVGVHSILLPLR